MKIKSVLLGLVVWLGSVGAAYYLGSKIKASEGNPKIEAPQTAADAAAKTPIGPPPKPAKTGPSVASLLALSLDDLGEALDRAENLSADDQRALLAEVFSLPQSDFRRSRMIRELLETLAETSPEEALALTAEIGSLRDTERARIAILEVWGARDPVAALAWASSALTNEPARSRQQQIVAIYEGYARLNPQAAFASALDLPAATSAEQRLQLEALEEIISEQIENGGLLEAKLQVELLEDGPVKNNVLSDFVDRWASYDPVGAAAYVDSLGDAVSGGIKARLVGEWAENDPAAAAAWLSASEIDEQTLSRAATAIIRQWTNYDMTASADWLNSQPSSPALDRAVMSYTYRAAQEDPASAMTWAESIENDWMRNRMMRHVAGTWKNDAPEAFAKYLENAELDEEQRKQLQDARANTGSGRWGR